MILALNSNDSHSDGLKHSCTTIINDHGHLLAGHVLGATTTQGTKDRQDELFVRTAPPPIIQLIILH